MNLGKLFSILGKLLLAFFLLIVVWFGLGSWLRNQQDTLLFYLGTFLNILILFPVIYLGYMIKNDVS